MRFEKFRSEEKQQKWQQFEQEVELIKDRLGKGVDQKIKDTVVALRANGFSTTGSCEGHLDWGLPWPWIDVDSVLAENLSNDSRYQELASKAQIFSKSRRGMSDSEQGEYKKLVEMQIQENEKEYQRLSNLLAEFYQSRSKEETGKTVHLEIKKGPWNGSRIQPEGMPEPKVAEIQQLWSKEVKENNLRIYRQETERFTSFLKERFFKEEI